MRDYYAQWDVITCSGNCIIARVDEDECAQECNIPLCGFSYGNCQDIVPASDKCEVAFGTKEDECLLCKPEYKAYYSLCLDECPFETIETLNPFGTISCVPEEDFSTLENPRKIYVN